MGEDVILLPGLEGFVYKGPTYLELDEKLKSNPLVYNLIQQNIARRNNPTKEIVSYVDANGNTLHTTNVAAGVLSPVDPLAEMYVAGKVLDPAFKIAGRAGEYGLARMGNNWARARILSRNLDNATSKFAYPVYEFLLPHSTLVYQPTKQSLGRTYLGLFERPSSLTKSEKLGMPKIERNFKLHPKKPYSGHTPTLQHPAHDKFVKDVMLAKAWAEARGETLPTRHLIFTDADLNQLNLLGGGFESQVYASPDNAARVLKFPRRKWYKSEAEAIKEAEDYARVRNKATFNFPLSVEGTLRRPGPGNGLYFPVFSLKKVTPLDLKTAIPYDDQINILRQSILRGASSGGKDLNNILSENGIRTALDFKSDNLGISESGAVLGVDLSLPGDKLFDKRFSSRVRLLMFSDPKMWASTLTHQTIFNLPPRLFNIRFWGAPSKTAHSINLTKTIGVRALHRLLQQKVGNNQIPILIFIKELGKIPNVKLNILNLIPAIYYENGMEELINKLVPIFKQSENLIASPGKTIFNILPYNVMSSITNGLKKTANFFRTPITENPFNHLVSYLDRRYFASARPLKNITSEQTYKTVLQDPISLLRERVKNTPISKYDIIDTIDDLNDALDIPVRNHTSIVQSFKDLRNSGGSKFLSFFNLPRYYWRVNTSPAFFRDWPGKPFVLINPSLKHTIFNKGLYSNIKEQHVLAHELAHSLWSTRRKHRLFYFMDEPVIPGFNFKPLPERVRTYFLDDNGNELAARGTLLKNYFGITDNTPITGDMLKYAAKNYVKDTGLDNNMNQLFRSITDWDKAAEWLSKYSYKQGGKMNILQFLKNGSGIHIKKENRGKFTDYCGGKVTSECIAKGKRSSNPAIRKRATFAANARKWKHKFGGLINYAADGDNTLNWWLRNSGTINTIGNTISEALPSIVNSILKKRTADLDARANEISDNISELELFNKYYAEEMSNFNSSPIFVNGLMINLSPTVALNKAYQVAWNKAKSEMLSNRLKTKLKNDKLLKEANADLTNSIMGTVGNLFLTGIGMLANRTPTTNTTLTTNTMIDAVAPLNTHNYGYDYA